MISYEYVMPRTWDVGGGAGKVRLAKLVIFCSCSNVCPVSSSPIPWKIFLPLFSWAAAKYFYTEKKVQQQPQIGPDVNVAAKRHACGIEQIQHILSSEWRGEGIQTAAS